MAAHAHLKNEFTEDKKYHNLMTWLNYIFGQKNYQYKFDKMKCKYMCWNQNFDVLSSDEKH